MADNITIEVILDDKKLIKSVRTFKSKSKKEAAKAGESIGREISDGIRRAVSNFGVTLIAALGIRKLIDLNREFGKSLAEIDTIAGDLGKTQEQLRNQLIQTSTQFGTSAREQARSFYQIISAGITNSSQANEVLIASNKLAIGGLTTTEGAIDLLTSTVNAFGLENLSASKAADILFGTVRLGKTRIEDLQSSLGLILPTAKALKIEFIDVAAAVAQLTTKGISTSEAVTQVNAVFTALLRKQESARKLGPKVAEAFTLQALQAKGLAKFLEDLLIATGGSEVALQKLLGRTEGVKAILSLAGDNFVGLRDKVEQLKNSTGAADTAFNIMTQTLDFKLKKAASKISGIILILSGDVGTLSKVLGSVNSELDDILLGFKLFGGLDILIGATVTNLIIKFKELRLAIAEGLSFGIETEGVKNLKKEIEELEQSIVNVINIGPPSGLDSPFKKLSEDSKKVAKDIKKDTLDIGKAIQQNLVASVSQGLQAVGAALVGGADGFNNFGKIVLGLLGDFAIRIGTLLIGIGFGIGALKASLATFNPAGVIAAGAALVVLGGALKALSGGIGAAPVGGGGVTSPINEGGGIIQIEPIIDEDEEEIEDQRIPTEITLIVQGDILDRRETGLQLAEVLRETFQTNDISFGRSLA